MEMHSQRSLYEIHGISAPPRREPRRGRIVRRAITRLLAVPEEHENGDRGRIGGPCTPSENSPA